MTISTTLSTAEVFIGAAGAVSDGASNATLVVTVRDTAGAVIPHAQVHVQALAASASMIVTHVHNHPTDPARRLTFTSSAGVAAVRLGSVSPANVTVPYLVYMAEDTPDVIGYATSPELLAGFFGKPTGSSGYGVGTIPSIPFTTPFFTTHQVIDDAWFGVNAPGQGRTVRNRVFAAGATLAFTVDPNLECRFSNCVFAASLALDDYALITQGRTFRVNNCGFRGSRLAALYGEGGTIVRSVFDSVGRDAVHINQGSTFTPSSFIQCRFQNVSLATAGYALRGTPMRNVTVEHCWFDLAGSALPLGVVYQRTDAGGSRGPWLSGCWIEGGTGPQVSIKTGTSGLVPEFPQIRACRFKLGSATTYVEFDGVTTTGYVQGNMDGNTGEIISSTAYPAANTTAGPLELWPQVTLPPPHPSIEWTGSSTGGGGGGGGGPGIPGDPGSGANLDVDVLYSIEDVIAEPVGGGPGGRVVRPTPVGGTVLPAVPIPFGGVVTPPGQPVTVQWDEAASQVAEGATRIITARLVPAPGQSLDPLGYSVGVVATYSNGATASEFVLPTTAEFLGGAAVAQFEVQSLDDAAPEGDETLTLTLQQVEGVDEFGNAIVVVAVGTVSVHVMTVLASDNAPPGPVDVYFGTTAVTVGEGSLLVPQAEFQVNVPILLSGNPPGQVQVSVAFTGTAVRQGTGSPFDYVVNTGTVYTFNPTANGDTPAPQVVNIRIISDTIFEDPNETIILTLTSLNAANATVVGGACTITIDDPEDPDPGAAPTIGWIGSASLAVLEGTNTVVGLGTNLAGMLFPTGEQIRVQIISQTATWPSDFNISLAGGGPPAFEPSSIGEVIALVPIAQGANNTSIIIRALTDSLPEDTAGETFLLRILDSPGDYVVNPTQRDLTVRILDQLSSGTDVFAQRIPGLAQSLVSCTVPASETQQVGQVIPAPADGWNMALNDGLAVPLDCQWYPVAYRPNGTPDAVHIWGIVPGAEPSVPGAANSVRVGGGTIGNTLPTLLNLATQRAAVGANDLRLTLVHDVNGESRSFTLNVTGNAQYLPLIDRGEPSLQGGGPEFFARWRAMGQLSAGTDPSADKCTVARVYTDFRADINAVLVTVNWGNYRWHRYANSDTDQHKTPNPYVDGDVFFESLHLEGVPDGWAAVMADKRSAVTDFQGGDVGSNRVRIIKEIGGDFRHYVPPLRGHIAYVVLYETATVTQTQAEAVLNGYDRGYCSGPLGIDRSDVLGELGTPALNYGAPANGVEFRDINPANGLDVRTGWAGSQRFTERQLNGSGGLESRILAGESDLFYGVVQRGWWLPFADAAGGAPGGNRIDISCGSYPGQLKRRKNQIELVHLWHRVGMVPWNEKGESITDEDFCIVDGTGKPRTCTAMWTGIGGQRMAHQHFYTPDFYEGATSGVPAATKLGPGRKRATGSVTLAHPMQAGDTLTIVDGSSGGSTWVFTFTTTSPVPADAGTTTYVLIGATDAATNENLYRAILAKVAASTFRIHPRLASDGTTMRIMHRFHGTAGNAAMTGSARVTVVGMAGGLDTNALAGVRLWNYLVPGTNRCNQDVWNDWHTRHVEEGVLLTGISDQPFHAFDWPHMSRLNEVTRDGWWLYLDPAAHDCIVGIGHLGTMCAPRFPEARSDASPWIAANSAIEAQLASATGYSSLALILEAHQGQYYRHFIQRGGDPNHPAATFSTRASETGGLNVGTWVTRNPQVAVENFSPSGSSLSNFISIGDWALDRGDGWMLAAVARMYAVDACHRVAAVKDAGRALIHPGLGTTALKPSWFEMYREVMRLTMHRSGAPSSTDYGAGGRYTSYGAPRFDTRTRSLPGGDQNVPTAGAGSQLDREWYSCVIAWHTNYIAMGAFAVMKRVYSWIDRTTTPTMDPAVNPWGFQLLPLWRFGRLLLRVSRRWQGGSGRFFVPSFVNVGAGDPALTGTANSTGVYGRFNPAIGSADPEISVGVNTAGNAMVNSLFWWNYDSEVGNHAENHYFREYLMWSWMYWRIDQVEATEMVNTHPSLVLATSGTISATAPGLIGSLMTSWNGERNQTGENVGDEIAWAIQWHANEFIV